MSKDIEQKSCGQCIYWDQFDKFSSIGSGHGYCRRKPPEMFNIEDQIIQKIISRFPTTREDDWCGECRLGIR